MRVTQEDRSGSIRPVVIATLCVLPLLAFATGPQPGDRYGELTDSDTDVRTTMRKARLNRSAALSKMLELFSAQPDREFRAIDFSHEADLSPGSVHPILDKLQRAGAIEVIRHGEPAPASIKRYRLTDLGARFALRYKAAVGVAM